jgi:hypothetical protein
MGLLINQEILKIMITGGILIFHPSGFDGWFWDFLFSVYNLFIAIVHVTSWLPLF